MRLSDVVYAKTPTGPDGAVIVFARDEHGMIGVIFHYQTVFRQLIPSNKSSIEVAKEYGWTPIKRCEWLRYLRSYKFEIPQIEVIK